MFDTNKFFSTLGESFKPGVLTEVVLAAFEMRKQGKKLISLTGGSYDPHSLPYEHVKKIFSEAPPGDWREMLQYGSNVGSGRLRAELSAFMAGAGIRADSEKEIIVTTGSQQALYLMAKLFLDPGDVVLIGSPTYLEALAIFRQHGPEFRLVPVDDDGMNTEALESELARLAPEGRRPKLLYTVPSFQNPTGALMPRERRLRMLELAEEHDFLVVEDNPYGYISFGGPMPTPMRGLDTSGRVIYVSTFSKIVSPGLRIGWVSAHREFIAKMAEAKTNIDICTDGISQYAAAELLSRGIVEKQIPRITSIYRKKRDLMLEAMGAQFPKEARWNEPRGGLFIWVKMPERFDTDRLLKDAVQSGVAYVPGSNFFADPSIKNFLRLNYSFPSQEDIVEGIGILGRLLKKNI